MSQNPILIIKAPHYRTQQVIRFEGFRVHWLEFRFDGPSLVVNPKGWKPD